MVAGCPIHTLGATAAMGSLLIVAFRAAQDELQEICDRATEVEQENDRLNQDFIFVERHLPREVRKVPWLIVHDYTAPHRGYVGVELSASWCFEVSAAMKQLWEKIRDELHELHTEEATSTINSERIECVEPPKARVPSCGTQNMLVPAHYVLLLLSVRPLIWGWALLCFPFLEMPGELFAPWMQKLLL